MVARRRGIKKARARTHRAPTGLSASALTRTPGGASQPRHTFLRPFGSRDDRTRPASTRYTVDSVPQPPAGPGHCARDGRAGAVESFSRAVRSGGIRFRTPRVDARDAPDSDVVFDRASADARSSDVGRERNQTRPPARHPDPAALRRYPLARAAYRSAQAESRAPAAPIARRSVGAS